MLLISFQALTREGIIDLEQASEQQLRERCGSFVKDLTVTKVQASNLEKMTRSQRQSNLWQRYRVGHVTATLAHDILTLRESTDIKKLVSN